MIALLNQVIWNQISLDIEEGIEHDLVRDRIFKMNQAMFNQPSLDKICDSTTESSDM